MQAHLIFTAGNCKCIGKLRANTSPSSPTAFLHIVTNAQDQEFVGSARQYRLADCHLFPSQLIYAVNTEHALRSRYLHACPSLPYLDPSPPLESRHRLRALFGRSEAPSPRSLVQVQVPVQQLPQGT